MPTLSQISARLRLDQATPVSASLIVGSGATFILAAAALDANYGASAALRLIALVAGATGLVLLAYGALMLASMIGRSGRFVRRFGSRLRFQSPIRVLSQDEDSENSESAPTLTVKGSLDANRIPGAPRPGLTVADAVRGWQHDRERLRRAVDIAVTWLYRRHNWHGLTTDARFSEPAPADIWARQKYENLGLHGLAYEPPSQVPVEPGWEPPDDSSEPMRDVPIKLPLAPTSRRPPKAKGLTDEAWAGARAEFCRRLLDVLSDGAALTRRLQTVPTTAVPDDVLAWKEPVQNWINDDFTAFAQDYFTSSPSLPPGQEALPPAWRRKLISAVTSRTGWLEQQRDEYGCTLAPAQVAKRTPVRAVPGERRFRDGDRVRHARWGDGIIVTSKLTRSDEEVVVAFRDPAVGRKTMLASLANLEVIG